MTYLIQAVEAIGWICDSEKFFRFFSRIDDINFHVAFYMTSQISFVIID